MPLPTITTIFFSADGVLRTIVPDPAAASQCASSFLRLLQSRETWESLCARLEERWAAYRRHAETLLLEAGERELWYRYLLPEYEPNMVCANAPSLTRMWLGRDGRREIRPGAGEVLRELCRRGYTLGLLENTPSEEEVHDWLVREGLVPCFRTVLLSSKIRMRKPDPAAYHLAARCAGTTVQECAFVGKVSDLAGASAAAFGQVVLLDSGETGGTRLPAEAAALEDLLDLFPERRDRG